MAPSRTTLAILCVGLVLGAGVTAAVGPLTGGPGSPAQPAPAPDVADGMTTFESESAYASYMQAGGSPYMMAPTTFQNAAVAVRTDGEAGAAMSTGAEPVPQATQAEGGSGEVRVGTTNVQEQGIDEPDVVKTVGRYFVYSSGTHVTRYAWQEAPDVHRADSYVIDTEDPVNPELVAQINVTGRFVRSGDSLVALTGDRIVGFDVSDPENPRRTWSHPVNGTVVTARTNDGTLYLVTRTPAYDGPRCPVEPLGGDNPIPCTDVMHPRVQIDADTTFVAHAIDPGNGRVTDTSSFVGTAHSTVVYMSEGSLYVTYTDRTSRTDVFTDFLLESYQNTPAHVEDRLREIRSYNLSTQAERIEVQRTIRNWLQSLPEAERRVTQQTLRMGFSNYVEANQRELTETGIVRIGVGDGDMNVETVGHVPGRPLDQFSMDEHEGTLRIATTVPGMGNAESKNDLYTLDADTLERQGSVQNMSPGQRIYAVRYVEDTAYLVTFRQVDPFHVVDLSDPTQPEELGQVELPGFSNYLHPVGNETIMGIGEQDGEVKAVLFDVSDPSNPTVVDSLRLNAGWSAISRTHHAFMQDARHGVAFIPTGDSGLVVDYTNHSLSVETRVEMGGVQRARYVGDYLYVFGAGELRVLDETTWERVGSLELDH